MPNYNSHKILAALYKENSLVSTQILLSMITKLCGETEETDFVYMYTQKAREEIGSRWEAMIITSIDMVSTATKFIDVIVNYRR
ncbi:MAG: hypothetical protein ABFC94_16900 [Syntrophomonas sp.]